MKITPTDADYEAALFRETPYAKERWRRLKAEAVRCAAERLLKANGARQKAVCQELDAIDLNDPRTHKRWHSLQDEISKLFADHEKLLDVAFPNTAKVPA